MRRKRRPLGISGLGQWRTASQHRLSGKEGSGDRGEVEGAGEVSLWGRESEKARNCHSVCGGGGAGAADPRQLEIIPPGVS